MLNSQVRRTILQLKKEGLVNKRGRPVTFDREEILEIALNLFWEKSFMSLSLKEIAKETGLTRASLYNTFGNKDVLFLEVLRLYIRSSPEYALFDIKQGEKIGPLLLRVMTEASSRYSFEGKNRGCLAATCFNELLDRNDTLGHEMKKIFEDFKVQLTKVMQQAIDQKELPQDTDPKIAAYLLFVYMNGISIFSKSDTNNEQLRTMAAGFLTRLGFEL